MKAQIIHSHEVTKLEPAGEDLAKSYIVIFVDNRGEPDEWDLVHLDPRPHETLGACAARVTKRRIYKVKCREAVKA